MTKNRDDLDALIAKLQGAGHNVTRHENEGPHGYYIVLVNDVPISHTALTAATCIKMLRDYFDYHD